MFLSVLSKGYIENSMLFIENTATNTYISMTMTNTVRFNTFYQNQGFEVNSTLNSNTQVQKIAFIQPLVVLMIGTSTFTYHRNVNMEHHSREVLPMISKILIPNYCYRFGFYLGSRLITPPSISCPLVDVDSTSYYFSAIMILSGIGRPP